ncbi:hypothetical protein STTU_3334 [Streptomyces sp. Tu6071]|nr:hypothetical protein STTU_3334 [Streptomyces sp. Tu6071]
MRRGESLREYEDARAARRAGARREAVREEEQRERRTAPGDDDGPRGRGARRGRHGISGGGDPNTAPEPEVDGPGRRELRGTGKSFVRGGEGRLVRGNDHHRRRVNRRHRERCSGRRQAAAGRSGQGRGDPAGGGGERGTRWCG